MNSRPGNELLPNIIPHVSVLSCLLCVLQKMESIPHRRKQIYFSPFMAIHNLSSRSPAITIITVKIVAVTVWKNSSIYMEHWNTLQIIYYAPPQKKLDKRCCYRKMIRVVWYVAFNISVTLSRKVILTEIFILLMIILFFWVK